MLESTLRLTCVAALGLALSGCAVAEEGAGEPDQATPEALGQTAAAITAGAPFFLGQPGNGNAPVFITSAASSTCFLTGVHGQLLGTDNGSASGWSASGSVALQGRSWVASTQQGGGSGLNIEGRCIPFTAHRAFRVGYTTALFESPPAA